MGRERRVAESGVYHVMSRGSGRQIIFEDNSDRRRFLELLGSSFDMQDRLTLLAWCLMDNHVHLLVSGELDNLSEAMRLLNSSYALYFNKRYDRVGHLFQGRYRSVPVETDAQLIATVRYIHQNPWKAGCSQDCSYPWSSYGEYVCDLDANDQRRRILELFGGVDGFVKLHSRLDANESGRERGVVSRRGPQTVPSSDAIGVARDVLGGADPCLVSGLPKPRRNVAIAKLGASGLSVRQIERLTGVPKSTVARAMEKMGQ